jgi:hypothetical protein
MVRGFLFGLTLSSNNARGMLSILAELCTEMVAEITMLRFNIALLPVETAWQHFFIALSQQHFAALHDEYILGENGLPHITLCQFYAPDAAAAIAVFNTLPDQSQTALAITGFRLRAGTLGNSGKFIADLPIEKTPALLARQVACAEHLRQHGLASLTSAPPAYSPHITLARLSCLPALEPVLAGVPYAQPLTFRPVLGLSTEPGVLVKVLAERVCA